MFAPGVVLKLSIKDWRPAKVVSAQQAADDILSLRLKPQEWLPHQAGQHYELRLPGHHLSRKYSIVSSPHQQGELEFGVQLLSYGLVSPLLWQLKPGDDIEIRGPLGAFVWQPHMTGPLVMIGAGSGITPFLSMYDYRKHLFPDSETVLVVSAKQSGRVMHYDARKGELVTRFTETDGRIDEAFLRQVVGKFASDPSAHFLTCGPGGFTGHIITTLMALGIPETQIRRETFS